MRMNRIIKLKVSAVYERMVAAYECYKRPDESRGDNYIIDPYICRVIDSMVYGEGCVSTLSVMNELSAWFYRPMWNSSYGIDGCFTNEEMIGFIRLGAAAVGENFIEDERETYLRDGMKRKERYWSRIGMLVDVMNRIGDIEFDLVFTAWFVPSSRTVMVSDLDFS